ncbi:uncharacterized protein LOC118644434 [Monomorium pharaonis]|uniref:uncharacterized protein LOC118644434 n=1 Tax=Monomorium pharaonis TaxID=307658 RepID=UPI0017474D8B|nr:uncharacterized protein LOC118644434 [Monomorium pharaonis]
MLKLHKRFLSSAQLHRMNSLEIVRALHQINAKYAGVYPADRLSRMWTRLTAIVANTDAHDRPGEHWVAFYLDERGTGTYFDSYGSPPLDIRFLLQLRRNSMQYHWNTEPLQGLLSQTYGQYCCFSIFYV